MSPTTQPVETTTATANTQSSSVRKRRRRTAATGAADDCFTCQKRRITCDRRRPYCTQCLDIGKDCSGYKTTLTWGVGVASRGKLRGLSLPVANSSQKAAQDNTDSKAQESSTTNSSGSPKTEAEHTMKAEETNYYYGLVSSPVSSISSFPPSAYIPSAPIPIPSVHSQGWHIPAFTEHIEEFSPSSMKAQRHMMRPPPLQRMASFSPSSYDDSLFSAPSTGSVGTFSESDFASPHELPSTPETTPCAEPFINANVDVFCGHESVQHSNAQMPIEVCQPFDITADTSFSFNMDPFDTQALDLFSIPSTGSTVTMETVGMTSISAPYITPAQTPTVGPIVVAEEHPSNAPSSWSTPALSSLSITKFPNLSPRTAYLIDYYEKMVCPVLVAVDGPTNPYRVHILALASTSNPALINAVAALAANVLHLRSKGGEQGFRMSPDPAQRGVSEEALYYKTASVNLFNSAVRDPTAAHDDSLLATLIVLSLFNISEGGIGKLKSQMPGIRQILALRGSNASQFLHWATYFFTLLDLMTAVVNDRAAQHRNNILDLLDFSANLGALEHLAHCEARMFKVIARLGRSSRLGSWSAPDSYRSTINPFTGLPMSSPAMTEFNSLDSVVNEATTSIDARQEFWSEWQHVRTRLRHMSRDPFSCPSTPSFSHGSPKQDGESLLVTHATEVFRHAALLFAERLAFPHISPSSPQIQHLVTATLHHFSSIPELSALNKILLWPLMVVGTECVQPSHRDVIRLRCGEAMRETGFFAGLSGLDILERVWAADDASWDPQAGLGWDTKAHVPLLGSLGGQAGRWRRAMCMVQVDLHVI